MKKYQIFILIALMLVTVFVFYPVLNAVFVSLDDPVMVVENWKIRSFSQENLKALFLEPHYKLYHPLVNLSYAIEYRFFGVDPYFYHADNLILHLFNTLFVFFIFFRLTKSNFAVSFITALIFACHPMHVEPVAWISGRKDTLYAFFFLASWLMYLKAYTCKGRKYAITITVSLVMFLCACLSKSMAVTLPVVLILCDWLTGRVFNKRSIMKYVPFVLVAAVFSFVTFLFYYTPGQKSDLTLYTLFVNFVAAHFNVLFYMVKFLLPVKLSVIYPPFFDVKMIPPEYILRSPAMLYAIIVLILWSLKKTKKIAFGFALFLITILPVINILPTGVSPVADRYTYIPFIGFGFILASGISYLYGIMRTQYMKNILKLAVYACLMIMCCAAYLKAEKWHGPKTLFDDIIKNYPGQISKAYINRALCYRPMGKIKLAEKDFETALLIKPGDNEAIYGLASIKVLESKYNEALSLFRKLSYDDYNMDNVYMHTAQIYYDKGDKETAFRLINEGIERFPKVYYLYETLAVFQAYEKEYDKAIENFNKSKTLNPGSTTSYIYLAQIYDILKKYELAEKEYQDGILNCSQNQSILSGLGKFYYDFGYYGRASVAFMQSVKRYPQDYESYIYLGNIEKMNLNYKKALYYFTLALSIKNDHSSAYFSRSEAHFEMHNYEKAAEDMTKAKETGFAVPQEYIKKLKQKNKTAAI